ncbi:hypothetical protein ABPG74_016854 [Tetrahymena malaccensis]
MAGLFDDMPDDWESKTRMTPEELEETTNYLKNHPLFMKEIPKNIEDYPELLALQNLMFDDTPENLAQNFKRQGNEHFKKGEGKRYFIRQALNAYTEGIEARSSEKDVNAQLHNNRALMNMKLKNFGKAIDDCKMAIKYDEKFIKAYFRKAQIESLLRRYDESLLTCLTGLQHEPNNKELLDIKKESEKQIENERKRREKIQEHKNTQTLLLHTELKKRKIYLGNQMMDFPDSCKKCVYLDDEKVLHIPIFVHYPEFSQMDYIDDTREKDVLKDHLAAIFKEPLPWDHKHQYTMENIEVYIEFNQTKPLYQPTDLKTWPSAQGYKKIDANLTLNQVFSIRGYVLPQVAEITVVSKISPFYTVFKEQYDFI